MKANSSCYPKEQHIHFTETIEELVNCALDLEERGKLTAAVVLAVVVAKAVRKCPDDLRSVDGLNDWCAYSESLIFDYLNGRGHWEGVQIGRVPYRLDTCRARGLISGIASYIAHRSRTVSLWRAMQVSMKVSEKDEERLDEERYQQTIVF